MFLDFHNKQGRKGNTQPAQFLVLAILVLAFTLGAEMFRLYVIRQEVITLSRNIAVFGASYGRLQNDALNSEVLYGVDAGNAMQQYYFSSAFETKVCQACTNTQVYFFIHETSTPTTSCIPIGDEIDYDFTDISDADCTYSGSFPGKTWTTSAPATAVYITTEVTNIIPFWARRITIRAFGSSDVYVDVPSGVEVFPWTQ